MSNSSKAEAKKPTRGLMSSALNTPAAAFQSTPEAPVPASNWLARPTPMMEPTSVCDELAGRPSDQVPRFQMIAAMSSEKIIAMPAPLPTRRISSTGSRLTMVNATVPEEVSTPNRLNIPDHTTAIGAGRLWV
jgi:hypothetical protein